MSLFNNPLSVSQPVGWMSLSAFKVFSLNLMDEPLAGVDAATEKVIIQLLQEMARQGKTVIVVHHDLQSASRYFS